MRVTASDKANVSVNVEQFITLGFDMQIIEVLSHQRHFLPFLNY